MPRRHQVATRMGICLPPDLETDRRPWHTVVMSRLGRNLLARRVELAMLFRFAEQAVKADQAVLAVPGTAAHRWLKRSCELLAGPLIELEPADDAGESVQPTAVISDVPAPLHTVHLLSQPNGAAVPLSRDVLAVMLADRVDATWVRPGGTIHHLLGQRLAEEPAAAVRVLIPPGSGSCAAAATNRAIRELLAAGAIGYFCPPAEQSGSESLSDSSEPHNFPTAVDPALLASLIHHPQRWLVHCTRAPQGPWPGQSEQQFRDGLLLGSPEAAEPTPLTTLQRILKQQKLVGTSRTVSGHQPVVCFSALPLLQITAGRRFRPHLGRWDAEPYGLAIDLNAAQRLGAQPVIYCDQQEAVTAIPAEQRWRRQSRGRTFDWTTEHEWRLPGPADLRLLQPSEIVVFVGHDHELEQLPPTPWPVVSIQSLRRIADAGVAIGPCLR